MNDEIILILETLLALGITGLCLCLSKYRYCENKKYAIKYENNTKMLLFRLIVTVTIKWGNVLMLIGLITKTFPIFIALYIFTPLFIAIHIMLFNTNYLKGVMTFTKGIYYVGLTIISAIQILFDSADITKLALGFTLSLAIFESVTALYDGWKNIQESKVNSNL